MKKLLLIIIATVICFTGYTQSKARHGIPNPKKANIVMHKPYPAAVKEEVNFLQQAKGETLAPLSALETNIGMTRYDLQTNQATQNRLYMYEDGTMAGVWTRGMSETAFSDRGTGYNFFDGTAWGPEPTQRIEGQKTGWPSYCPLGANGELVVSHTNASGLAIDKRTQKGTGTWNESVLPGPVSAADISWPRAVTSGTTHDNIHIIASTYVAYQGQANALLYYRSQNGGTSWDKQNVILPGMGSADYTTFGGDCYSFAEPKGDTLAFVVGDNWVDLFLMKSLDGGENWTKTVIFQHPYPHFDETTTLVLDTPTVTDGSINVILDHQGKAHVFFGLMKVLNTDLTDAQTEYFPASDGLGYWREGMPTMTNISEDSLDAHNQLVGYTQDINGNDTILEFDGIAVYYLSVTSMPNAMIDDEGRIFLFMTSIVEGLSSGSQNYRHIYGRMSADNGNTWSDFIDITGSIVHNFNECVFPTVALRSNSKVHVIFQMDDEPGLAVRGDSDPYSDNTIVHSAVPKSDFGVGITDIDPVGLNISGNYPNPAHGQTTIMTTINKPAALSMQLTDISGRLINQTDKGMCQPGTHYFILDCKNIPQGVYFYTVRAGNVTRTGKMIVQ